jgi:hypothetical protein
VFIPRNGEVREVKEKLMKLEKLRTLLLAVQIKSRGQMSH